MVIVVDYKGQKLECRGHYFRGYKNSLSRPEEPDTFEFESVYYKNVDITSLLEILNFDWVELESICLSKLEDY